MKKQILASLFLFTIFFVTFVFAQEKFTNKEKTTEKIPIDEPLYTRFYKAQYLELSSRGHCFPSETGEWETESSRNVEKFKNLLLKRLSPRGEILIDDRSNTLIIMDEIDKGEKVELVVYFAKLLDESGFNLEEIVNNPNFEIK